MAYPRPAFYPGGAPPGYVPAVQPGPPLQQFSGFPPGFNPAMHMNPQMIAMQQMQQPMQPMAPMQPMQPIPHMHPMQTQATPQPTPEAMRFALPPQGHSVWQPPPLELSDSEESKGEDDSDESESDDDVSTAVQKAYWAGWEARGRSHSREPSHKRHGGGSDSVPREMRRGHSLPPAIAQTTPMMHRYPGHPAHGTPHRQPRLHLTPAHQMAPLPGSPQQQAFNHQQPHGYFAAPTLAEIAAQPPHLFPSNMRHPPHLAHAPTTPHRPPLLQLQPEQPIVYPYHPQPGVLPGLKKAKKRWSRSKSQEPEQNFYGMLPNPGWGQEAAKQAIIDPTRVSHKALRRVLLHPLLAAGCRDLMVFNAIRPPAALTAPGHTMHEFYGDPATAPPMSRVTFWTGVHQQPITIENPQGVTVLDVIKYIGDMMFGKLKRAAWDSFSDERKAEITNWFHHNRIVGKMPPEEQGVRMADLLGPNTMFSGMKLCEALPGRPPLPPATYMLLWGPPSA